MPEIPEIPEIPGIPEPLRATKWAHERPRDAIFDDLGRFRGRFSSVSEVTSHKRLDSQRKGTNLCFCWQAQYFRGFADFTKKPNMHQTRQKIAPNSLRKRTAQKKIDFSVLGCDSAWILVDSARFRVVPGDLSGIPGRTRGASWRSPGAPGMPRDAPETIQRRLRDALGSCRASREGSRINFGSILGALGPLPGPIVD